MNNSSLLCVFLVIFPTLSNIVPNNRNKNGRLPPQVKNQIPLKPRNQTYRPSFRDVQLCQRLARCECANEVLHVLKPFSEDRAVSGLSNLSAVCLSTAIHRIAKDASRATKRLQSNTTFCELLRAIQQMLAGGRWDVEGRHVANIAWAAARLDLNVSTNGSRARLFQALARETVRRAKAFR